MIHKVQQGECLSSIAARYGFTWRALWDAPENKALRDTRRDPNILFPGDGVHVPERAQKSEPSQTAKRHVFKVRVEKASLHLRLVGSLEPLAGEPYTLTVGRETIEGETDGEGMIDVRVPADLSTATLILPKRRQRYTLAIGRLDPVDTASGAKARLQNLRLYDGEVDGATLDPDAAAAIQAFQRAKGLTADGELTDRTVSALHEEHGS